jgi:hypothetical protein
MIFDAVWCEMQTVSYNHKKGQFPQIHRIIILLSASWCSKWLLTSRRPDQTTTCRYVSRINYLSTRSKQSILNYYTRIKHKISLRDVQLWNYKTAVTVIRSG